MNTKLAAILRLTAILIVTVLVGYVTFFGIASVPFTYKKVIPAQDAIQKGLDLSGGVFAAFLAKNTDIDQYNEKMAVTRDIMRNRLDGKGYTEATISMQGSDRIRVEIPEVEDPDQVLEIVGSPGKLEFVGPDEVVIMDGSAIEISQAGNDPSSGAPVVQFVLNAEGKQKFADATTKFVGQKIAIKLNGEVITNPNVQNPITNGEGVITGMESNEAAKNLALQIQSGAMPIELEQIEVRNVSATLGMGALESAVTAGVIGVILVMLFMILMYRLNGLLSSCALVIYLIVLFLLLANVPGVQLTLPGIAGIILSVGMAVDANCIIFERIKEELRAGKSLRSSVDAGFKNALSAIIDSNVTTIIAAVVLMMFGTGSVKGFAITLAIGVLTSMLSAVVVTRFLLRQTVRLTHNKWMFGLNKVEKELKVPALTKSIKTIVAIPAIVIVVSMIVGVAMGGLNLGIDFTGGTLVTLDMKEDFDQGKLQGALSAAGVTDSNITRATDAHTAFIRMRSSNDLEAQAKLEDSMMTEINKVYANAEKLNSDRVGAVAGSTLVTNALFSLFVAAILMLLYVWVRFEFRQGVVAVGALVLNILLMISVMMILRNMFQVNSTFVAAVLTVVGYTINNTIVVFDRVRENLHKYVSSSMSRGELVDRSVAEIMRRTINSSITTLIPIIVLYIMGVPSVKEFALPIIVGVLGGLFTSVFVAAPCWAVWTDHAREKKRQKKAQLKKSKANS